MDSAASRVNARFGDQSELSAMLQVCNTLPSVFWIHGFGVSPPFTQNPAPPNHAATYRGRLASGQPARRMPYLIVGDFEQIERHAYLA
jgi:hypothetical protein